MRIFVCTAYTHVDNGKLEPRAVKCIFLGYKSGVKGFKLWNLETQKVVISRNVIFNESAMLHDVPSTNVPVESEQQPTIQQPTIQVEHVIDSGVSSGNEIVDARDEPAVNDDHVTPTPNQHIVPPSWNLACDRVRRGINKSDRLTEECNIVSFALSVAEEIEGNSKPSSYSEGYFFW